MALNTLFDHLKKPSCLGDSILNISLQDILITEAIDFYYDIIWFEM